MTIDKATIDELKEIFVTRQECDTKNSEIATAMSDIKTRLSIVETLLERSNKIQMAIFTGVLTSLVGIVTTCIIFAIKSGAV